MTGLTWKQYLKNYSSIKGLDEFISEESTFPYGTVENRESLVVVHHHLLKSRPDFLALYRKIEDILNKNNPSKIFFSHANPQERPFSEDAIKLSTEKSDIIYILGCFGDECIYSQVRFLKNNQYGNIIQMQKLIQGNCIEDSCSLVLR